MDADLPHTSTNGRHGLPIIRNPATLDLVKLMPGFSLCRQREGAKVIQGTAEELNGLEVSHLEWTYNILY